MDREIAIKWADLLDSEEFTQGGDALNCNGKHCGLGVLCELAIREGIITPTDAKHNIDGRIPYDWNGSHGYTTTLPRKVQEWADMFTHLGEVERGPMEGITIAFLNDSGGYTFPELAQFIRENYDDM